MSLEELRKQGPMPETAAQWRERQRELMAEAAARVPDSQKALADVLLGASVHSLATLKIDLDEQREILSGQVAALETHGAILDKLSRIIARLDEGLGVSVTLSERTLEDAEQAAERAEDLFARIGPPDPRRPESLMERLTRIERAGRRRDLLIGAILLVALAHLLLSWLGVVPGPLGLGWPL